MLSKVKKNPESGFGYVRINKIPLKVAGLIIKKLHTEFEVDQTGSLRDDDDNFFNGRQRRRRNNNNKSQWHGMTTMWAINIHNKCLTDV